MAQLIENSFVIKLYALENGVIRIESNLCAGFTIGLADDFEVSLWARPFGIFLLVEHLAVATDGDHQTLTQRVHHAAADTMQAAGNLIAAITELTTSVQHSQNSLNGTFTSLRVNICWNTATIVDNSDAAIS